MSLGLGIEAARKVGRVGLEETWAVPGVLLVVLVDAAGCEDGAVDALEEAAVGQVQSTNDIGSHGVLLVVLAPVDIGAAGAASSVENVGGLDTVELLEDLLAVLHANSRGVYIFALALEDGLEVTGDPALTTPDQKAVSCLVAIDAISTVCAVGRHVEGLENRSDRGGVGLKVAWRVCCVSQVGYLSTTGGESDVVLVALEAIVDGEQIRDVEGKGNGQEEEEGGIESIYIYMRAVNDESCIKPPQAREHWQTPCERLPRSNSTKVVLL